VPIAVAGAPVVIALVAVTPIFVAQVLVTPIASVAFVPIEASVAIWAVPS